MVREILRELRATLTAFLTVSGQSLPSSILVAALAMAGVAAFLVTWFGLVAVYVLAGAPPGLAGAAGAIGFGGGLVVASLVVIKLVRAAYRHPRATAPSNPAGVNKRARRSLTEIMASVASLDRHLAPPADDADASPMDRDDSART